MMAISIVTISPAIPHNFLNQAPPFTLTIAIITVYLTDFAFNLSIALLFGVLIRPLSESQQAEGDRRYGAQSLAPECPPPI